MEKNSIINQISTLGITKCDYKSGNKIKQIIILLVQIKNK